MDRIEVCGFGEVYRYSKYLPKLFKKKVRIR